MTLSPPRAPSDRFPAVAGTVQTVSIQSSLQSKMATLPPTMKRIAEVILARPTMVAESTISELARACETSEASVVRFCNTLGFPGYPAMRLVLVAELAKESAQFERPGTEHGADIIPADSIDDMIAKISASEILGIQETAESLDRGALSQAIEQVSQARRVILFGIGASNATAQDLAQKLLRINHVAHAFHDAHDALVSAALVDERDVAIAFSHGGTTRETVTFLKAARAGGAHCIAITNTPTSELTTHATAVLRTAVRETMFRSGAMASRIAQLTVVDYLFVGVARAGFDLSVDALKTTAASVKELRGED